MQLSFLVIMLSAVLLLLAGTPAAALRQEPAALPSRQAAQFLDLVQLDSVQWGMRGTLRGLAQQWPDRGLCATIDGAVIGRVKPEKGGHWEMRWVWDDLMQLASTHVKREDFLGAPSVPAIGKNVPRTHNQDGKVARFEGNAVTYRGFDKMTPDVCYFFCQPYHTVYFALNQGKICTCFDTADLKPVAESQCNVKCEGDEEEMCGGSGVQWNVSKLTQWVPKRVVRSCGPPPEFEGATTICEKDKETKGEVCQTTCNDGFRLKSNSLSCDSESGEWSGKVVCGPIECRPPFQIPHALSTCKATKVGSGCGVECLPGYEILGSNTLKCATRVAPGGVQVGFWAGQAVCAGVSCGKPKEIAHAHFSRAEVRHPDKVFYTCKPGFTTTGTTDGANSFYFRCGEHGTLRSPSVTECKPITCGSLPAVPNALVVGQKPAEVSYPNNVLFKCNDGYTLDGTGEGLVNFPVACMAAGVFSEQKGCERIRCGIPPTYAYASLLTSFGIVVPDVARVAPGALLPATPATNVVHYGEEVSYKCDGGYSTDPRRPLANVFKVTCDHFGHFEGAKQCTAVQCDPLPDVPNSARPLGTFFFPTQAEYSCLSGYTVDGLLKGPVSFRARCRVDGTWADVGACRAVQCPPPPSLPHAELLTFSPGGVVYPGALQYKCAAGFSTDGSDASAADEFTVPCLASGQYARPKECIEIDDCIGHNCGPFGVCRDLHMGYTCDCSKGFEMQVKDGEKICGNIDDCGIKACGMHGKCKDLVDDYTCECDDGYELIEESPKEKFCKPKKCGVPAKVKHADAIPSAKVNFPTIVQYTCHTGHHVKGTPSVTTFSSQCQASGAFTLTSECVPFNCGPPPSVENATVSSAEVSYPGKVEYQCAKGHSTDGNSTGDATFWRHCLQDGHWSTAQSCFPITCGAPPHVAEATVDATPLTYTLEAHYTCMEGYAVDPADPQTLQFVAKCEADGKYSGVGKCKAIVCGLPPDVNHAAPEPAGTEISFPGEVQYNCAAGYTIDGTATGATAFVAHCAKNAKFEGLDPPTCRPVTCGNPPQQEHVVSNAAPADAPVFRSSVPFECQAGYAVAPYSSPVGLIPPPVSTASDDWKRYTILCNAQGMFETLFKCKNIDDCAGHTCGPHGVCVDSIEAYDCECELGYELTTTEAGEKWCGNINDCTEEAVNNCGAHGTCEDLAGSYTCWCAAGYELVEGPPAKCKPKSCPELSAVEGSTMTAAVAMKFPDSVTVTCKKGWSVDSSLWNKEFDVKCQAEGILTEYEPCKRVACSAPLPSAVANTQDVTTTEYFYEDKVEYKCIEGHTVDGKASSSNTFTAECSEDTTFHGTVSCSPVSCGKPMLVAHGTENSEGEVLHGGQVTYHCDLGYQFTTGTTDFDVKCQADGTFSSPSIDATIADGKYECKPVSCGEPPKAEGASHVAGVRLLGGVVEYTCDEDLTIDGTRQGLKQWSITCEPTGQFSAGDADHCTSVKYQVQGQVINALNTNPIETVTVEYGTGSLDDAGKFTWHDFKTAETDHFGLYSLTAPAGKLWLIAKKDGWVTTQPKEITVDADIAQGGAADITMTTTLAADEWRIVLKWGASPLDLDSWTTLGRQGACELGWDDPEDQSRRLSSCPSNGWSAVLDVDDQDEVGPETTTLSHIDASTCKSDKACKVYFRVHNYSGDPTMTTVDQQGRSAEVTLYNANRVVRHFRILDAKPGGDGVVLGDGFYQNWYVFSIDVKNGGVLKACEDAACD